MSIDIRIHRGKDRIGGSIIEISTNHTRVILDTGIELDDDEAKAPDIEGLFIGEPRFDAVFISHYHGDHIGLLDKVLPDIPAFIGEKAAAVTNAARRYLHKPEYHFARYYESGKRMTIGNLAITPYLCDHSAYDAYMLHVSDGHESVLYTGDFRANGRKSFSALLSALPAVDTLITEGTTLSREGKDNCTERELEAVAAEAMSKTQGPVFVMMSAQNIDRIVTIYKAARRSRRMLLQDLYTAAITEAAGEHIPNPKTFAGVRVFMLSGGDERYDELLAYGRKRTGRSQIAEMNYVMCVRPSMKKYLQRLLEYGSFETGILFYSMWDGYKKKPEMEAFLRFMQKQRVTIIPLHTSGHADARTIDALIKTVQPKRIIPVHTENAEWFERYKEICAVDLPM